MEAGKLSLVTTLLELAAGVAIIVWGAVLHELTHAAAAKALGGRIRRLDLLRLFVDVEIEAGWRRRAVFLAPGILGLLASPLLVVVAQLDASLMLFGSIVIGWVVYTFNGGAEGELRLPGNLLSG
jgi:hypothetical protein